MRSPHLPFVPSSVVFECSLVGILLDRLMYTITSRKEMPNKEFCEEIAKAADDLFELFVVEDAKM